MCIVYVGCLDYTGSCPYAYVYGIGISYGYREDAEVGVLSKYPRSIPFTLPLAII